MYCIHITPCALPGVGEVIAYACTPGIPKHGTIRFLDHDKALASRSNTLSHKKVWPCKAKHSIYGILFGVLLYISEELPMISIPQISFASALSSLSDRRRFKSYFRTTPSFKEYASSIVALLDYFNWTRLALLTENQNLFKTVC